MKWFADWLISRVRRRADIVIGASDPAGPYLLRWFLIPKNPYFNIFLHKTLRDDASRDLHCHPWYWASLILRGQYIETYMIDPSKPWITEYGTKLWHTGSFRIRRGRYAHRLSLFGRGYPHGTQSPCWTLFFTGPHYRDWGFYTAQGWMHWRRYGGETD